MNSALRIILGVVLGGGAGYAAGRLLCIKGGCPITSNWPLMALMGAVLGVSLFVGGCTKADDPAQAKPAEFGTVVTTVDDFNARVVASGKPALVDFYADWCGPCQVLKPVLAKLETEYAGKVDFYRVDVDKAVDLARAHEVSTIPTLLLFEGGHQHGRIVGAQPAKTLRKHLDALLAGH